MTRDELFASIVAASPGRDDIVYLERTGDTYDWRIVGSESLAATGDPDVWMSFSAAWPLDEPARLHPFFDDLLADVVSMAEATDRCRWPIDDPWPHHH
jgi:hypothetical protein